MPHSTLPEDEHLELALAARPLGMLTFTSVALPDITIVVDEIDGRRLLVIGQGANKIKLPEGAAEELGQLLSRAPQ